MTKYIAECSECRFHVVTQDEDVTQRSAEEHETRTGHQGPFVWRLTDELQETINRAWRYRYV